MTIACLVSKGGIMVGFTDPESDQIGLAQWPP
jgi:hypothetical protein